MFTAPHSRSREPGTPNARNTNSAGRRACQGHETPLATGSFPPVLAQLAGPPGRLRSRIEPKTAVLEGLLVPCGSARKAGREAGTEAR